MKPPAVTLAPGVLWGGWQKSWKPTRAELSKARNGNLVDDEPAVLVPADRLADDIGRVAQRPHHERGSPSVLDGQVDVEHSAERGRNGVEPVLEGVPAFHVDRVGLPSRVLREGSAPGGVVAGADHEPGTGTRRVRVRIEAGVEDEVAPVHAGGRADRRRPVEPRVVRVWGGAAVHVRRRDVEIEVHRGRVPAGRERGAVAAPEGEREPVAVVVFGVERAGLRGHAVSAGWDPRCPGPPGRVRFEALEKGGGGRTGGPQDQARGE